MAVTVSNSNTLNPFLRINLAQIYEACAIFGVKQGFKVFVFIVATAMIFKFFTN